MINLLKAEFFMGVSQKKNFILAIILCLISILFVILFYLGETTPGEPANYTDNWRDETEEQIKVLNSEYTTIKQADTSVFDELDNFIISNHIDRLNYHLDNNIPTEPLKNLYSSMISLMNLIFIICLISAIISGKSIAKEYDTKTIEFLLTKPYTKLQIFLSKYISNLLKVLTFFMCLFIPGFILSYILYGNNSSIYHLVLDSQDNYIHVSFFRYFLLLFLSYIFMVIIIYSIGYSLSVISRSVYIAVGISVILYISGPLIISFLSEYTSLVKILPMANWNLTIYLPDNTPPIMGMNIYFSIFINIITITLSLILAFYIFKRRDHS